MIKGGSYSSPSERELSYTHQHNSSHSLQTNLGSEDTTPKQSGWLFLPPNQKKKKKKSLVQRLLIDVSRIFFHPPPSIVSGFQDGRFCRTDGIAAFTKPKKEKKYL